jgi:hypothetical protein
MDAPGADGLFIGIGFQKCATTQITLRLAKHPEIWPYPVRELRYWNSFFRKQRLPPQTKYLREFSERLLEPGSAEPAWQENLRNLEAWTRYAQCTHQGPEEYLRLFEIRRPEARAWGEISPNYAMLGADEIGKVDAWLGRPRLFVIMRDPVARALSQINHESRLRPQNVSSTERQVRFLESDKVREMADYPRILSALRSLPDQDRIGIFFFEDFVESMEAFFRDLCAFLGVGYDKVLVRDIARSGRKTDYRSALAPAVHEKAAELYGGMGAQVAGLVGRTPAAWDVTPAR